MGCVESTASAREAKKFQQKRGSLTNNTSQNNFDDAVSLPYEEPLPRRRKRRHTSPPLASAVEVDGEGSDTHKAADPTQDHSTPQSALVVLIDEPHSQNPLDVQATTRARQQSVSQSSSHTGPGFASTTETFKTSCGGQSPQSVVFASSLKKEPGATSSTVMSDSLRMASCNPEEDTLELSMQATGSPSMTGSPQPTNMALINTITTLDMGSFFQSPAGPLAVNTSGDGKELVESPTRSMSPQRTQLEDLEQGENSSVEQLLAASSCAQRQQWSTEAKEVMTRPMPPGFMKTKRLVHAWMETVGYDERQSNKKSVHPAPGPPPLICRASVVVNRDGDDLLLPLTLENLAAFEGNSSNTFTPCTPIGW